MRKRRTLLSSSQNVVTSSRFAHIDALRAVAVLVVVLSHAGLGHLVPGGAGVTVFFTVSGFVISYVVIQEYVQTGGFSTRAFYTKRFLKLIPPLVVCITIPSLIAFPFMDLSASHIISQLLFYSNWVEVFGDSKVLPGSGVTWSLGIEEQFYIGFALLWFVLLRYKLPVLYLAISAGVLAVISFAVRFYFVASEAQWQRIYYGTDCRLESIAIGIVAAVIYTRYKSKIVALSGGWSGVLLFASISLIVIGTFLPGFEFRFTLRFTFQAAGTALFILYGFTPQRGAVSSRVKAVFSHPLVLKIGLASYSIYLVHLPIILLLNSAGVSSVLNNPAVILFRVVVGMCSGLLVWRYIEIPIERRKKVLVGWVNSL